jgi:glycosyltransferase involved in cell wall biosynthesis
MLRVLSIATLFPSPPRPAFGRFVANQMRAVAARGEAEVVVIHPIGVPPWPLSRSARYRPLDALPEAGVLDGLPVRYPRFRLIPRIGGDSNPARIATALLPQARALHAAHRFDVVDAQFFFPDGPAAALIAADLGLPLTIKARGSDIHFWGRRPRALAQMLRAAQQAGALLAVSEALRQYMIALGMPGERITVHYTGLDRARFHPIERRAARALVSAIPELGVCTEGPLIVTPGALIAIKGQRLALAALERLPGAHLAFAGTGEDEAMLRRTAQERGIADRVQFLGQVSHALLPQLFSAADAVVLPSEREGLANVWVEALACGAPLVIPDIGGAREVIGGPTAGRIAARDPAAIAAALRDLFDDPPSQEAVAANAERFSWDANARQLAAIWRGVAAG